METWVLEVVRGDHAAAVLLAQLLWWHQPGKNGKSRASFERGGERWLLRADDEWAAECSLSVLQVRRIRRMLVDLDLVVCARFRRDGAPTSAWRPNYDTLTAVPEVDDSRTSPEGQLPSSPSDQLGSGPRGQVPIPSTQRTTTSTKPNPAVGQARPAGDVERVFNAWVESTGKTGRTKLTGDRRGRIVRYLRDYPVEDLMDACRGWQRHPHYRGENDRNEIYNDLDICLRDAKHIELFRDLQRGLIPPPISTRTPVNGRTKPMGDTNMETLGTWLDQRRGAAQ